MLEGALPLQGNTPQKVKYGLYAEQINGNAFSEARALNHKVWVYRTVPSAKGTSFKKSQN